MTDTDDSTTEVTPTPPAPVPVRIHSPAGGLALLFSLITLVGLGYLWYALSYQTHILGINVAQKLQSQDQAVASLNLTIAKLSQSETRTQLAIQALSHQQQAAVANHNGQQRWHIRAAEDLLLIANNQLHFEHNVSLALLALHQAEQEIRRQRDPRLFPVRAAILQEILRLQGLRKQHVSTMALEILALAHAVRTLPQAVPDTFHNYHPQVAQAPNANFWQRFIHGLWRDFVNLIRIRKEPIHETALLSPKRAYYVRENMQLRLYTAELALLEHRTEVMHANLVAANRWINRYYDTKAPSVQAAQQQLQDLTARSATLKWPDISGSLHLLRRLARSAP
ncbi:MAG TPA: uroporphyrinogen-III C-methyltransferase [Acidiferrobacter sp.]|nr:uroporphyrinogen-III C-methyltransferase [Acidiferrobacter sp.]